MAFVYLINSIALTGIGVGACLLGGVVFLHTGFLSGDAGGVLFILRLVLGLLSTYLCFLGLLVLYYRAVLATVKEREGEVSLTQEGFAAVQQRLRVVLDRLIVKSASPLLLLAPGCLKLLGAKTGRGFVMAGAIYTSDLVEVGDNVVVGSGASLFAHILEHDKLIFKRIKIGDNCVIGVNSVLMPGVEVGSGAIVASCASVSKNTVIPPGEIWGGIPARKIGDAAERS